MIKALIKDLSAYLIIFNGIYVLNDLTRFDIFNLHFGIKYPFLSPFEVNFIIEFSLSFSLCVYLIISIAPFQGTSEENNVGKDGEEGKKLLHLRNQT